MVEEGSGGVKLMAGMGSLWLSLFVQAGVFLARPAYPTAQARDADLEFAEVCVKGSYSGILDQCYCEMTCIYEGFNALHNDLLFVIE